MSNKAYPGKLRIIVSLEMTSPTQQETQKISHMWYVSGKQHKVTKNCGGIESKIDIDIDRLCFLS